MIYIVCNYSIYNIILLFLHVLCLYIIILFLHNLEFYFIAFNTLYIKHTFSDYEANGLALIYLIYCSLHSLLSYGH